MVVGRPARLLWKVERVGQRSEVLFSSLQSKACQGTLARESWQYSEGSPCSGRSHPSNGDVSCLCILQVLTSPPVILARKLGGHTAAQVRGFTSRVHSQQCTTFCTCYLPLSRGWQRCLCGGRQVGGNAAGRVYAFKIFMTQSYTSRASDIGAFLQLDVEEVRGALDPLGARLGPALGALRALLEANAARRKPKIAKGTRDFLPAQMAIRAHAFRIIERAFARHGAVGGPLAAHRPRFRESACRAMMKTRWAPCMLYERRLNTT